MVNDEIIPNADDEHKPPSQDGSNTEQTPETLNSYVDTEVAMPMGLYSEFFHTKVKERAVDRDAKPIRVETCNPVTNTRQY